MPGVELTAGTIEYEDTGGDGPVVVLVHGLGMDGSFYRNVIPELRDRCRVIVPVLPLGGHCTPMRPNADLSPRGLGRLQAEFLDALDLRKVTLVGNDSGLFLFAAALRPERIARLVVSSCELFENFPPGLPGKSIVLAAKVPGGLWLVAQGLRLRFVRRQPTALGLMSLRPVPGEITDRWFRGLATRREIRRDLAAYLRSARRGDMMAAVEGLRGLDRPVLVLWGAQDRVMPLAHGRRLAELLPHARLVEIEDSGTLIPEDQPVAFARAVAAFLD
ncbi:alpha/beta fold hydrolase [Streptomyces sp. GC420]|uniref:alpha/beta fold hydrolase n=1 Tax=Streptomyces sp. GC420 TaxID=2697568 RepID=UPI0014150C7C|nr:alpha/beta hydrolase [Streptomyces sp. GC420]NBM16167.1 alpha/beta fold hydrolase [Streptomyces sp. GC420]